MIVLDYAIILAYLAVLIIVGITRRSGRKESAAGFILGGRRLTLPAFVATLVSTWYGGILGVGEYSFTYGISNWLVFGLPYYLAAVLFAVFLARKARRAEVLTIPDRLAVRCVGKEAHEIRKLIYDAVVHACRVFAGEVEMEE